ncbi:MAG: hypothetical protein K6F99_04650 [Lachnospiraceae bacterium]|nr:hypothetical protein [Lachnospiraceae bacterium]
MLGFDDEFDFSHEVEEYDDIDELRKRKNFELRRNQERIRFRAKGTRMLIRLIPVFLAVLVLIVLFMYALSHDMLDFSKKADMEKEFGLVGDQVRIVLNGEYSETFAKYSNDKIYFDWDFVKQLDDGFYFDSNERILLYTNHSGTNSWQEGTDVFEENDVIYISSDIVSNFLNISLRAYEDPRRVVIYTEDIDVATITRETKFRLKSDNRSDIIAVLDEGETVRLLQETDDWDMIEKTGFIGYVRSEAVELDESLDDTTEGSDSIEVTAGAESYKVNNKDDENFSYIHYDGKVLLGFHQVTNTDANSSVNAVISASPCLNVIAPTWYSLSGTSFTSLASQEYVSIAHGAGIKVWGVVDNFNNPDFSPIEGTDNVLSHTTLRTALEEQLVSQAKADGLDGINIDFEQISEETGDDFAQFIRELSLLTHEAGIALSVDNYVPKVYNSHYYRDVQGRFADYVVIMGYDENTNEVGPNASIEFVTDGIRATLDDVPNNRVINAVPFYTRVWAESAEGVTNTAMGMTEAKNFVSDRGGEFEWSDTYGCNYAEFESGGAKYYVWLEDDQSLELKLTVMKNNDLGGAAFWKLGLEDSGVWALISSYASK